MIDITNTPYVIVGAGFFGAVMAERIANDLKQPVLVIDQRNHLGGNCYSRTDDQTGIEYHVYGTHIFHTSYPEVWEYIQRFTKFNGYHHQVLTTYQNKVYQMPINLETINSFYNLNLKPFELDSFLETERAKEPIKNPQNLEEQALVVVGRPLYEAFIKGYTQKQWQKDPTELPAEIIRRLPVRSNYDERYTFDIWEGIPLDGYTAVFERLLDHHLIDVMLETDFFDLKQQLKPETTIIYTGPIDRFFNYQFGKLEWRTLQFEHEVVPVKDYQGTAVMNYAEVQVPYTRIHEPRHLHPEREYQTDKTLIIREYSRGDSGAKPFYPVNTSANTRLFKKYAKLAGELDNVIIGGRL